MNVSPTPPELEPGEHGLIVMRRLHRMVRHGYRPWLGYDVASGDDMTVQLRHKDGNAIIHPNGAVMLEAQGLMLTAEDAAGFDSRFPPNTPNKRNIMRRLYEIGFLAS